MDIWHIKALEWIQDFIHTMIMKSGINIGAEDYDNPDIDRELKPCAFRYQHVMAEEIRSKFNRLSDASLKFLQEEHGYYQDMFMKK